MSSRSCLRALLFLIVVFALTVSVHAAETGISIEPVPPASQTDPAKSYFDLVLQPGEQEELLLQVSNTSSVDMEVAVELITASTGEDGRINYITQPVLEEPSLLYAFSDIAQAAQNAIVVPVGETEQISVLVTMPDETVSGVILGAIQIVQQTVQESDGPLVNEFAYAVAVQLANSAEREALQFALGDVEFSPQEGRAAITAHLRNTAAAVAKDLSVSAVLLDDDGNSFLNFHRQPVEMAPNSVYALQLLDDMDTQLAPGDYRLEIHIDSGEMEWSLESSLSLTAAQLAGAKNTIWSRFPVSLILLIIGAVAVVVVLILLGLFLYVHMQNRKYYRYMRQMERKQRIQQERTDADQEGGMRP